MSCKENNICYPITLEVLGGLGPTGPASATDVIEFSSIVTGDLVLAPSVLTSYSTGLGFGTNAALLPGTSGSVLNLGNTVAFRVPRSGTLRNIYFAAVSLVESITYSGTLTLGVSILRAPSTGNSPVGPVVSPVFVSNPSSAQVSVSPVQLPISSTYANADTNPLHGVSVVEGEYIIIAFDVSSISTESTTVIFPLLFRVHGGLEYA